MIDIRIESLLQGARSAIGVVAIIDVFRAFTTAAVALANGADKVVMVRAVDEALALRAQGVGRICMGETRGRIPPGFDYGNSPFEVSGIDFAGATIIQRTSAGTQGIVAAIGADRLYAASLVTAAATMRALRAGASPVISLVAMGDNGVQRTDEDEMCALHLRHLLDGRQGVPDAVRQVILAGGDVARFHDPSRPDSHPADLDIALDIDRYDFAIRVRMEDGHPTGRIERQDGFTD
jgi:2-phosphosulfolactate phosphatase